MDQRKVKILNSIIKSYIESKEPVGSRSLSKDSDIGVSAATIRNEMSDLEELGYLEKLHSSSGRIPSNRGYRLYVDALLSNEIPFEIGPKRLFNMDNFKDTSELDNVIRNATKMLAYNTGYTGLAMIPEMNKIYLKYINIVALTPRDLVIIYIYNSKEVINDSIRLRNPVDNGTVDLINSLLNSTLLDKNYGGILEALNSNVYDILRQKHHALNEIVSVIANTTKENSKAKIVFEGLSNMFLYNDDTIENNQNLINYLKTEDSLMDLLADNMDSDLQVYIGDEIGIEEFDNFSIITMTFRNHEGIKGKIGVLGPNNMRYDKVIADIVLINEYINGHIERR
ncbi:heat-inducible transcriptional repressor HrcA [Helcococcus sueciensis]|uniref:heat-inducible transcriptional repressor HrcA n=1 Tax=Helcococcus sueciensis TaxID=241555 RepID=UPI00146B8C60|nr:heat-inducible transcriptional repressor HrcA [Helcococcus sueciensis]